jgi:hypothetical protein
MELILRKRSTGDFVRLRRAKVLSHFGRKLAFLAPYAGQWIFYALASSNLRYNREPAPARRRMLVGDLLDLNSLELVVDCVEAPPGSFVLDESDPSPCDIELPGQPSVRVCQDLLIGYDPSGRLSLEATPQGRPLAALLTFAAGQWHLHDLNGKVLERNGQPGGLSLVLVDGDRIRIQDQEVVFRIGRAAPSVVEPVATAETFIGETEAPSANTQQIAQRPATPSQEFDFIYRRAKGLCQRLLPALRHGGRTFRPQPTSYQGVLGWLRFFRRPDNPVETLDRLELLLSGSPRDRVWLLELARLLYRQSYFGLCLRIVKELCRLYPTDGELMQTLAKVYFQQGRNAHLPSAVRLGAFEKADKCALLARLLTPRDHGLADLQQAVSEEQSHLRGRLAGRAPGEASCERDLDAIGGLR